MNAYKVQNKSILRVVTMHPQEVDSIVRGFPGLEVINEFQGPNGEYFCWVVCPNEEVCTALGNLMRTIKLEELPIEEYKDNSD